MATLSSSPWGEEGQRLASWTLKPIATAELLCSCRQNRALCQDCSLLQSIQLISAHAFSLGWPAAPARCSPSPARSQSQGHLQGGSRWQQRQHPPHAASSPGSSSGYAPPGSRYTRKQQRIRGTKYLVKESFISLRNLKRRIHKEVKYFWYSYNFSGNWPFSSEMDWRPVPECAFLQVLYAWERSGGKKHRVGQAKMSSAWKSSKKRSSEQFIVNICVVVESALTIGFMMKTLIWINSLQTYRFYSRCYKL